MLAHLLFAHLLFTNVFSLYVQLQEIRRKGKAKEILFVEIFSFFGMIYFIFDFFFLLISVC